MDDWRKWKPTDTPGAEEAEKKALAACQAALEAENHANATQKAAQQRRQKTPIWRTKVRVAAHEGAIRHVRPVERGAQRRVHRERERSGVPCRPRSKVDIML